MNNGLTALASLGLQIPDPEPDKQLNLNKPDAYVFSDAENKSGTTCTPREFSTDWKIFINSKTSNT